MNDQLKGELEAIENSSKIYPKIYYLYKNEEEEEWFLVSSIYSFSPFLFSHICTYNLFLWVSKIQP